MELTYTSPLEVGPGIITRLLGESYAGLVEAEPETWEAEKMNWEESDRNVFKNPDTVGACTFLTWCGPAIAGLFSFDPRSRPAYGVIGHNCILPEYRKQGFVPIPLKPATYYDPSRPLVPEQPGHRL